MYIASAFLVLNWAAIARADLVGHWKFDEGAGTTAYNSISSGVNGTIDGATWINDPSRGWVLSFDGINDVVTMTGYKGITGGASRSVSMWIKTDGLGGTGPAGRGLIGWGIPGVPHSPGTSWQLVISKTAGTVRISNCYGFRSGGAVLSDSMWHHVVVTLHDDGSPTSGEIRLYADGTEESYTSTNRPDIAVNTIRDLDVQIGNGVDTYFYGFFAGLIDDVAIFDHALNKTEVKQLYELGSKPPAPDPMLVMLCEAIQDVKAGLAKPKPEDTVITLQTMIAEYERWKQNNPKTKIAEYERWKQNNPNDVKPAHEEASSDLYYLLAKGEEVTGARKKDVAAAFERSASLSLKTPHYVSVLLWLFRNIPADDYAGVVKKSVVNTDSAIDHIHRVAMDFEAHKDLAAFELFLNALFSKVNDAASFAEAVERGLENDGVWANWFLRYSQSKPELTQYVIRTLDKHAQQEDIKNEFLKAPEIYRTVVNKCSSDRDKATYEFKLCECLFNSGRYTSAVSELDNFIIKNNVNDKTLIRQAILLKGQAYLQLGKMDLAKNAFQKLVLDYPEAEQVAEAKFFIGYCNMLENRFEDAKETLNFVVKDYPQSLYASKARLCLRKIERTTK